MSQEALGNKLIPVAAASGKHISLKAADAVTFISFLDAGTQTVSLKQSKAGASETDLPVITTIHKSPGVGGTWTKVTQAAAASFNLTTDATNDSFVFTVRARQLDDGFDSVEATANSGILIAIVHDLNQVADPTGLPTVVVA